MAKAKETAALTLEERLEQALVPEADQPYSVPENWCWVKLPHSFYNFTDSKKKVQQKAYLVEGDIPIIDQGQELVGGYTNLQDLVFEGNLPVIIFGDHTRCLKYIDFPFVQGADGVKVLQPKPFFLPICFFYAMHSVKIPHLGYRRHFPMFDTFAIPIPPLSEQQRIVDRIESLFAKLDEAKEKAQATLDSFETRKAAILHKAFTGELTAKWREENGVGIENWENKYIKDLGCCKLGKMLDSIKNEGNNIQYLRNVNVRWFDFDLSDIAQMKVNPSEMQKYSVKQGDLFICEGGEPGRCAVWGYENSSMIFQKALHRFRPNEKITSLYLAYYLLYLNKNGKLQNYFTGTTIKHLTGKSLAQIPVQVPTASEQTEIIYLLDNFFAKEQKAKDLCSVIDNIDLIKKSILARAFRGELGTNDPTEESAVELLKSIV